MVTRRRFIPRRRASPALRYPPFITAKIRFQDSYQRVLWIPMLVWITTQGPVRDAVMVLLAAVVMCAYIGVATRGQNLSVAARVWRLLAPLPIFMAFWMAWNVDTVKPYRSAVQVAAIVAMSVLVPACTRAVSQERKLARRR